MRVFLAALVLLAGCSGDPEPSRSPAASSPPAREAAPPPARAPEPRDPGPVLAAPPQEPDPPPPPAAEGKATVVAHTLSIALDPAAHAVEGTDTLSLEGAGAHAVDLELNKAFTVSAAAFGRVAALFSLKDGKLHIDLPAASEEHFTLTVTFKGTLFDPPHRDEVRFITGEKCSGTVQPEGAFLPGGAGWYPDAGEGMKRFTVTAKIPETWEFIGQGARHDYDAKTRTATWCDPVPADRLDCVAGPYVAEELKSGRVTVRSYFFKDDVAAAEGYRKSAADWIEHYSKLLGPYAYDDFSVVENFFSTGFGMPSYTLLGQDVVRMGARYLGEGGLGHEVLHCWWGNGVFVEGGNWCEAATTYCSNYYWVELTQGAEAARKYRRHEMIRYTMHVNAANDYPVRKFLGKVTEADNEIGYAKGSMLFHLVRRRIGDAPFWAALRRIVHDRTGARASWDDFRKAFEAEAGDDLGALFRVWLDEKGAPEMVLAKTEKGLKLTVAGPLKDFRVKVRTTMPSGPVEDEVEVKGGSAEWTIPATATAVEVDPEADVFRRLAREELPVCLNRIVVDETHAVVLPDGDAAPYKELLERLEGWEQIKSADATPAKLAGKSVLVLGGPDANAVAKRWAAAGKLKSDKIEVRADGWSADNEQVKLGADRALLLTVPSPDDADRQATVFFPASAASAKPARLLLYYAWDSWLVWRDGKIAARGEFETAKPLAVSLPK
jgi:aminopeptidase N